MKCYHTVWEWTWERWQCRGTMNSRKLWHYCNLTIRLFSVISRTIVWGGLTPLLRCSRCILQPQPTGWIYYTLEKNTRRKTFMWCQWVIKGNIIIEIVAILKHTYHIGPTATEAAQSVDMALKIIPVSHAVV